MVYILLLLSPIVFFNILLNSFEYDPHVLFSIVLLFLLIIVSFVEYKWPYKPKYKQSIKDYFFHIPFLFFERVLMRPLLAYFYSTVLLLLFPDSSFGLQDLWPKNQPIWIQSCLAFFVITFGSYWAHRLMHTIPFLWRFHRLHHLPQKLSWAITYWNHPIHLFVMLIGNSVFIILFQIPSESVFHVFFLGALITHLNHANIRTKPTLVSWFFPSICEHEIHHANDRKRSRCNYGVGTLFWDHVFRTYQAPQPQQDFSLGVKGYEMNTNTQKMYCLVQEFKEPFVTKKLDASQKKA